MYGTIFFVMAKENSFDPELFFSALADRTRLRLLNLMRGGEVCVCFFADTLGTNDPKISRHLSYLKRAGLVKGRREGKWVHYSIVPPEQENLRQVFEATLALLGSDKGMQADQNRLVNICCARAVAVSIQPRTSA